jgi:hypothetical protein
VSVAAPTPQPTVLSIRRLVAFGWTKTRVARELRVSLCVVKKYARGLVPPPCARGVECPGCGRTTTTVDAIFQVEGAIRRRRECQCGCRFLTTEQVEGSK